MPNYQKGTGPNQLPQGGATQANASTPPPAPGPSITAGPQLTPPDQIPVEYGPPQPVHSVDVKESENSQLLTSPSDPEFQAPSPKPSRLPKSVMRNLPIMAVAKKNPDTTQALTALYGALIAMVEQHNGEFD